LPAFFYLYTSIAGNHLPGQRTPAYWIWIFNSSAFGKEHSSSDSEGISEEVTTEDGSFRCSVGDLLDIHCFIHSSGAKKVSKTIVFAIIGIPPLPLIQQILLFFGAINHYIYLKRI